MNRFEKGQRVRVIRTEQVLAWADGEAAVGHEFVLDGYSASQFNSGLIYPEPPPQKFGINYHPDSLIIVKYLGRLPMGNYHELPSNTSMEEDLAEAHRLAGDRSPVHENKSSPLLSDLDKCDQLASTVEKPNLKEVREAMKGLRLPIPLEPIYQPKESQYSKWLEKHYATEQKVDTEPKQPQNSWEDEPRVQPILISRRKSKHRVLQMAPHQRPVLSDPLNGGRKLQ